MSQKIEDQNNKMTNEIGHIGKVSGNSSVTGDSMFWGVKKENERNERNIFPRH